MRTSPWAAAALLTMTLALCGWTVSCRCSDEGSGADAAGATAGPGAIAIEVLRLDDQTPHDVGIDSLMDDLQRVALAALGTSDRFTVLEETGEVGAYELEVSVVFALTAGGRAVPATQPGKAALGVEALLLRRQDDGLYEKHDAAFVHERDYDPATDGKLDDVAREMLRRQFPRALDRIRASFDLQGGDDAVVLRLLDTDNAEVQVAAVREAGERGLRATAAKIASLLPSENDDLRYAALGALGRIRDDSTSAAVAALTRGPDLEQTRMAVLVLGDIGGPRARQYLETLAYSHPVDLIRDTAKEALAGEDDEEGGAP